MKYFFLLILIFISVHSGFAQYSFDFMYSTTEDDEIIDGIQDANGNFILCGRVGNYSQDYNPLLIKVYPNGEYITKRLFSTDTLGYLNLVIQAPDGNYMFFGKYSIDACNDYNYLWVVKTDTNLNIIFEKSYYVVNEHYHICHFHSVYLDNNSNYIVAGGRKYITGSYEHDDLWMIKMDLAGDTLFTRSHHYNYKQAAVDFTKIPSSDEYMLIGGQFDSYTSRIELFRMDSLFNKTGFTNVPKNYPNIYLNGPQASSDIWLNDTVFLLSTTSKDTTDNRGYDSGIGIFAVDTAGTIHNQLIVGKTDTTDYAARYNSMATVNDTTIYFGGYVSILDFWPQQPSFIELYLTDTALNLRGYKQFGGDAFYRLNGIIPSSDGGCMLYATRYDHHVNYYDRDIKIIKMQRNDMDIITNLSTTNDNSIVPLVYPNPVTDILNIQLDLENAQHNTRIVIYTIDGKKVFSKQIEGNGNLISIEVSPLQNGLYICKIQQNEKTVHTQRFIKSTN